MNKLLVAISLSALMIATSQMSAEARDHSYQFINPYSYNPYRYGAPAGMSYQEWILRRKLASTSDPAARQYLTNRIYRLRNYGY